MPPIPRSWIATNTDLTLSGLFLLIRFVRRLVSRDLFQRRVKALLAFVAFDGVGDLIKLLTLTSKSLNFLP